MSSLAARRKADRLVEEFRFDKPPIDVRRIAKELGLRVSETKLQDVSGILITQPGSAPCIVVNASDPQVRRRFTLGHELGHHVLGHQFEPGNHVHVDRGNFISFRSPRSALGSDPREVEANQFASVLLMPTAMLKREVAAYSTDALLDWQVERLATLFAVSIQAMTIRLNAIGLL